MYKGNIFKFNQVIVQNEDTLVIDNNEKVAKRIEYLEELMLKEAKDGEIPDSLDGFTSGLDAEQVEALTADLDTEEEPSPIIKAEKNDLAEALSIVSAQAQEMLEAARREAENIKSQALIEAQSEIEQLRRDTYEEARSQGYDNGYNEAMAQVEQQKEKLLEEHRKLEAEYQELIDDLEPKFVETLTDIYEKVFQIDLKKEHDIVMHLISSTMHKIEGNSNYLIHVSKEDYPYVNLKKNETLASAVSMNAQIEIVEDVTLGPNDCIIETDGGVFDCGLGTQLEELSQKLKLLSYKRG